MECADDGEEALQKIGTTVEAACHAALEIQADFDIVAAVRDNTLNGSFAF